jgi:hypothetical protein
LDGAADGLITISSTKKFKVKSSVVISATSLPNLTLEIKRVIDKTTFLVGPVGSINLRSDLSLYTVLLSASVTHYEQDRPKVPIDDQHRASWEAEPTLARRSILVDEWGEFYDPSNPLSVQLSDGAINIGSVNAEVEVQLSHKDNYPDLGDVADSVRVGDGVNELKVNGDGSINVVTSTAAATTTPTIENYSIVLSGTEYSYSFPLGTKQFSFVDRDGDAKTRIAYVSGDTATKYKTIKPGNTYEVNNISTLTGFAIYFQSNKANRIIEIVSWK